MAGIEGVVVWFVGGRVVVRSVLVGAVERFPGITGGRGGTEAVIKRSVREGEGMGVDVEGEGEAIEREATE